MKFCLVCHPGDAPADYYSDDGHERNVIKGKITLE